ncbi:hypothetical protein HMPREF1049_0982 [Fusobacterium necrophorum subsp. funduliforme ATCC 51357]|uniref:Uncharacterized protein n=1 Tax=Fusobacterium necrophorum subsp. funduliforme Fnf 1007 TaxID=1161424 RepID=A0AAN3VUD1_9FUSO|nr:hypothetical protein HMPREF1049_0982 [Fusobacterium necrophorum subsp. funduliforme ATCC 51357]EJU15668.1 hypothetical protein HMPREF1127_0165 [Fusobacterium necrophorum subsp. funduliforme Fnf 1007]
MHKKLVKNIFLRYNKKECCIIKERGMGCLSMYQKIKIVPK